jgi:hypothetical protein
MKDEVMDTDKTVGELRAVHALIWKIEVKRSLTALDLEELRRSKDYVKRAIKALTGREGER